MATGIVMYQFILDYHFINHNLITIMSINMICILQVRKLYFANILNYFIYTYMHTNHFIRICMYTDTVDVNTEAENLTALSSVYQSDYRSAENSTLQCCVAHDGASDDRADKYSISSYYHHRKRFLALHSTTTNKQCK